MKLLKLAALTLTAHVLAGCAPASEDAPGNQENSLGSGYVATIGDQRIPESVYRLFTLNTFQTDADDLTDSQRSEVVNRLIQMKLLEIEAERNGLPGELRIGAQLELIRMQILASAMSERYLEDNPPTALELREVYQENLARLSQTQYKTRHILVDTQAEAEALLEELAAGADFAALATERSNDQSSEGGDLGWITASTVVPPFAAAIEAATPGELFESAVQTQYGWHVILVEDVQAEVPPGIDAVRQDLAVVVNGRKLEAYLDELREAGDVMMVE